MRSVERYKNQSASADYQKSKVKEPTQVGFVEVGVALNAKIL
ncbi:MULTISPECIES: hypothetical protein [Cyanophyceae]|nr:MULTISPECIES: hypothetical protein [Cyanophyceae]